MKVSGFTFIRNAVKYDYPIAESVKSILPVCNEYVIALGDSSDKTRELIESIGSSKIKIIDTVWDNNLREGGRILAQQTDIALSQTEGEWCFYLQADEVVHEKHLEKIYKTMENYTNNKKVEGLLFRYTHFYGNYDYTGSSRRWYRNEIRIVRNNIGVQSYKDAQGFRRNGRKINVVPVDAEIYHYGWVKPPGTMQSKMKYFHSLWHPDEWVNKEMGGEENYDFSNIDELKEFSGTHPEVMKNRISGSGLEFRYSAGYNKKKKIKHRLLDNIENISGVRLGEYKNYKIIKP